MLAPAFGLRTGMPRAMFDALWSSVAFSKQVVDGGETEESWWQLIEDFVFNINLHLSARVTPSDLICVDESMSKWYGQGGHWILKGLPMYVAIDRKPENGCEVQNAACGRSGLMLRLSIVTTAEHRQGAATTEDGDLPHGTIVLKHLVAPWAGTKRKVCADSYFAIVTAARQLLGMGLRFIGVVKTATRGYPMGALSVIPHEARGQHVSYNHSTADGVMDLMALLWVDRERRYFIASTSTSLMGTPYERMRWRQTGAHAERVVLTVPQPHVAETYYTCCSQIDRHNRCRQDDLRLEHKLVTHDWSMRVNLSLLGMCEVDAWMLYSGARGGTALSEAERVLRGPCRAADRQQIRRRRGSGSRGSLWGGICRGRASAPVWHGHPRNPNVEAAPRCVLQGGGLSRPAGLSGLQAAWYINCVFCLPGEPRQGALHLRIQDRSALL